MSKLVSLFSLLVLVWSIIEYFRTKKGGPREVTIRCVWASIVSALLMIFDAVALYMIWHTTSPWTVPLLAGVLLSFALTCSHLGIIGQQRALAEGRLREAADETAP